MTPKYDGRSHRGVSKDRFFITRTAGGLTRQWHYSFEETSTGKLWIPVLIVSKRDGVRSERKVQGKVFIPEGIRMEARRKIDWIEQHKEIAA